jgi:hypothetical protein
MEITMIFSAHKIEETFLFSLFSFGACLVFRRSEASLELCLFGHKLQTGDDGHQAL